MGDRPLSFPLPLVFFLLVSFDPIQCPSFSMRLPSRRLCLEIPSEERTDNEPEDNEERACGRCDTAPSSAHPIHHHVSLLALLAGLQVIAALLAVLGCWHATVPTGAARVGATCKTLSVLKHLIHCARPALCVAGVACRTSGGSRCVGCPSRAALALAAINARVLLLDGPRGTFGASGMVSQAFGALDGRGRGGRPAAAALALRALNAFGVAHQILNRALAACLGGGVVLVPQIARDACGVVICGTFGTVVGNAGGGARGRSGWAVLLVVLRQNGQIFGSVHGVEVNAVVVDVAVVWARVQSMTAAMTTRMMAWGQNRDLRDLRETNVLV